MESTIENVYKFYQAYPEYVGKIKVNTRFGYKSILAADITAYNSKVYEIKITSGVSIKTSPNHQMLSNDKWVMTKDLSINDNLVSMDTPVGIESITLLDYTENLYDLQVEDVHEFYANGLVSHNSTILDALTLGLFGKPFRNVNKGQLVNSINGKNLLVEIEFDVGGSEYLVKRGIKPSIFEIWKNGILITQDAALKDYQTVLEQQILRMGYRVFCQVVILGSASFVPFMQLSSANRREVIEDILDIRIFSTMNSILKDQIQASKQKLDVLNNDINISKTKVDHQQTLIKSMETGKQEQIDNIQARIDSNHKEIVSNVNTLKLLTDDIEQHQLSICDNKEVLDKIDHTHTMKQTVTHGNVLIEKTFSFFDENDDCPSCSQQIPHEHKSSIRNMLQVEYDQNKAQIDTLDDSLKIYNTRMASIKLIESTIISAKNSSYSAKSAAETLIRQNRSLEKDIINTKGDRGNIKAEREKLKLLAASAVNNITVKTEVLEQRNIEDIASLLLKDTGIKTSVIREYLPTINKLIAKFLNAMELHVQFELDESFTETIKSRFRDEFTYASFSEGEKIKIDLALLFTFREIARMKNSANTNLLIMDEILSGSLDSAGTDNVLKLITNAGNEQNNCIVISHYVDDIIDKFDRVLTFEKRHDFSEICLA
jgi:DNA repair exonuclease SbcCD ATPase subunit